MLIRRKKGWELPERIATPEARYVDRRRLLAGMGIGGLILAAPAALGPTRTQVRCRIPCCASSLC
jgi:methionine sulfoxide reductase catalytic subunit